MPKRLIKKNTGKKEIKTETPKKEVSSVQKVKMLITVIDRSKTLFYVDLLEQYEVNLQMVIYGRGTANSQMLKGLGIVESEKAVILSVIREDMTGEIVSTLQEKFEKVKNGKGIAYTIPLQSVIGASIYQFMSNNKTMKKEEKSNG